MRHQNTGKKFSRSSSHRAAMFRNMVTSLIEHERITTTEPKAKELRRFAEEPDAPRLVLGGVDRAVVQPERVVPALGDGVDHRQSLQRRVRRRGELDHPVEDLLEDLRVIAEPLVAEPAGALADHLGHLRFDRASERFVVERHDLVGLVEIGCETFDFLPRRHRVWRVTNRSGSFLELNEVGHADSERQTSTRRAPVGATPQTPLARN